MQHQLWSERNGFASELPLQINSLDERTRNALCNIFQRYERDDYLLGIIWEKFFGKKISGLDKYNFWERYVDRSISYTHSVNLIESWDYNKVFDLIEFILSCSLRDNFSETINTLFLEQRVWYSIIVNQIVPIISPIEIKSIESAIQDSWLAGVNTHMIAALKYFSDRDAPDFRNSTKESIFAVEAVSKAVAWGSTFGDALKELKNNSQYSTIDLLIYESINKIYAYTNSPNYWIRHATGTESKKVTQNDALFMLVTCSAIINLLVANFWKHLE